MGKIYKTERWLNNMESPSTGSVVCYDGESEQIKEMRPCTFVEISDCHSKVRLYKNHTDSIDDYIQKLEKLALDIITFKSHLVLKYKSENRI